MLDAAHALMDQGVFRYRRPPKLSTRARDEARRMRDDYETRTFNDLWRTVPKAIADDPDATAEELKRRKSELSLPQENLLYFLEKHSPVLETWQRELLRITRSIAQYFYPQKQTKVMNEGCATFVHYYIMNALYDRGLLTEGAMLEALHNHSNVVFQADFDDGRGAGLNPYALGFAMMRDIKRICEDPSPEDEAWFPDFAGSDDWRGVLKDAWANYRDESFIQQFLSPRLIRELKLFALGDDAEETHYTVEAIHDERGYREVRRRLAAMHDLSRSEPDIQVVDVDLLGDRELHLRHTMLDAIPLEADDRDRVLAHLKTLWGYDIRLESVDGASGESHETASTRADGAEMSQEKASNSS